ncbi:phytase [Belliella marina]|uniref:Phytase n=1 Tax=Belliella marina TaxID=1644146 RepID=A0ABW4VM83_9BACT
MFKNSIFNVLALLLLWGCQSTQNSHSGEVTDEERTIQPVYVTDTLKHDSDDPAIWVNPKDPSKSLVIGTDKDLDGALYVFDLEGKTIDSLVVRDLKRPNNVDVGYGFQLGDQKVDFAVTGERFTSKLRFYSLPDMKEIVQGGVEIYIGETGNEYRDLMGVAVYHNPDSGRHYIIAGRKNGPTDGTYLWQYEMLNTPEGLKLELVRKFGKYSGKKEIEAIAVDHQLGYIYYSDEGVGVRKYYADPEKGNEELALFAQEGFTKDHEGISIYQVDESTGYILVSDQEANFFHVFPREGTLENPHQHQLITKIPLATVSSDGSEVINFNLSPKFPKGLFVAMSDNKTFQLYDWRDLEKYIKESK